MDGDTACSVTDTNDGIVDDCLPKVRVGDLGMRNCPVEGMFEVHLIAKNCRKRNVLLDRTHA